MGNGKAFTRCSINIAECSSKASTKRHLDLFINGGILKELFANDLGVFETYGRNKLYINLYALSWIIHLFVRFWNIFGIGRMNCHNSLLTEESV